MIHRIKSKRFFVTAILLSFAAHFMICLVLRGYKNDRCPLSFAFQCGNYGLGNTPEAGSADDFDDGRIQVQFVTHSDSSAPNINTTTTQHHSEAHEPTLNTPSETFIASQNSSPENTLETLGQTDTIVTQSSPTPALITTTPSSSDHTPSENQKQKTTQSTLANNYHNDLLSNSENPGPGLSGGRANKSASAIRNPYPAYPSAARRNGLEGEVMVTIDVSETGRVNNVVIAKSSGHSILDQEVLKTIRKAWRFTPATQNNKPIPTKEELVFRFVLDQK